ncbi:MAG: GIY-YIG nuclease family protein, partial [Planctomycetes bacterium]|nr:GIY-YIG nuclease family protein [Planctomycetota bacterium]
MAYAVYVLRSKRNGKRYVGFTGKPVEKRLEEHNRGCNLWSRQKRPFELLCCEQYGTESEARRRERYLKSGAGRRSLDESFPKV